MRSVDIDYIHCRLKNQKMTGQIRSGDRDEAYYQAGWNNALHLVDVILMETPTIEAEPVRHGRWYLDENGEWACSHCDGLAIEHSGEPREWQTLTAYCPNCGAKMDLKGE